MAVTELLERVREIAPVLERHADASERQRHLHPASVAALREARLFRLWWPECLGGSGADLADAIAVIEALAEVDTAAAWNLAVGTGGDGMAGAYLADHAVKEIFAREPVIAGQLAPIGAARRVDGGLRLEGRWSFGSGIHQADWVLGGALLRDGDAPPTPIVAIVPAALAAIDEASWQVAGLAGTGSCDYRIDDAFVPEGFWFHFPNPVRLRGGAVFDLPILSQVLVLHAGFPLGAARRSLREVAAVARKEVRAFAPGPIAQRETFRRELGEAETKLAAARALVYDVARRVQAAGASPAAARAGVEGRSVARYATDVAIEVALWAYRSAGGSALQLASPLQRNVRDLLAAAQHIVVDESAYTAYGDAILGEGS